jgi:hypothetical protein
LRLIYRLQTLFLARSILGHRSILNVQQGPKVVTFGLTRTKTGCGSIQRVPAA